MIFDCFFSVCLFCYNIFIVTLLRYVSNELKELLTYLLTYSGDAASSQINLGFFADYTQDATEDCVIMSQQLITCCPRVLLQEFVNRHILVAWSFDLSPKIDHV